ncbi:hypothetical protein M407DRAFT_6729 [Tulasnella calospora MUT 4182]|uniref:Uncharacterized protein n=1 Tax=Tulasnella calospora MUT 4182 TaxID=1051891 RepID=A0A0C3QND7_9AGAM|nr:hypothetical protein M407DRAFT_6729 [Tulasnella calospora MUT 4182]
MTSNAFNQSVPAYGGTLDLDDDEDLRGPPRTGWIVAVDGNGTVLGFVPKEADKLGNLPITIEVSEALVVRYTPPGTTCSYIEALNARLGYPYSRPSYLSASWFSSVKENEKPVHPNFSTISHTNEMVGSWTNSNGPTQHDMWRVYSDNSIQPYWHTGDDDSALTPRTRISLALDGKLLTVVLSPHRQIFAVESSPVAILYGLLVWFGNHYQPLRPQLPNNFSSFVRHAGTMQWLALGDSLEGGRGGSARQAEGWACLEERQSKATHSLEDNYRRG